LGQGIKGMIGTKVKVVIVLMLLLFAFSIYFVTHSADYQISGSIDGNTTQYRLEKSQKDNHYYISYIQYDKKEIKLECTKEQYNFVISGKDYYMICKLNLFNRTTGKIFELDDKPLLY